MKKIIIIGILSGFVLLILLPESFKVPTTTTNKIDSILTLSPSHTKILDYLGLGDKIIGVSVYDEDPKYQDRKKIGGGVNFDQETVLRLHPDLITIGDIQHYAENISFLESQGIKVLTLNTKSFQDIYQSLLDLQNLFPENIFSNKILQFQKDWEYIKTHPLSKRQKVLVIIGIDPVYTIAQNNYMDELISYIGWDNSVTSKSPYPILSDEDLIRLAPIDSIIITTYLTNEALALSNIQNMVQATNIIVISNKNFNLPSPYLIDLIKEFRETNHSF